MLSLKKISKFIKDLVPGRRGWLLYLLLLAVSVGTVAYAVNSYESYGANNGSGLSFAGRGICFGEADECDSDGCDFWFPDVSSVCDGEEFTQTNACYDPRAAKGTRTGGVCAPDNNVLFVSYQRECSSREIQEHQVKKPLDSINGDADVDHVYICDNNYDEKVLSDEIKTKLNNSSYEQVWIYYRGMYFDEDGEEILPLHIEKSDREAFRGFHESQSLGDEKRNVIVDARINVNKRGILNNTQSLIENYYTNLKERGGGIVYLVEDASDFISMSSHSAMFRMIEYPPVRKGNCMVSVGMGIQSDSELFTHPNKISKLYCETKEFGIVPYEGGGGDYFYDVARYGTLFSISTTIAAPVCVSNWKTEDPSMFCRNKEVLRYDGCGRIEATGEKGERGPMEKFDQDPSTVCTTKKVTVTDGCGGSREEFGQKEDGHCALDQNVLLVTYYNTDAMYVGDIIKDKLSSAGATVTHIATPGFDDNAVEQALATGDYGQLWLFEYDKGGGTWDSDLKAIAKFHQQLRADGRLNVIVDGRINGDIYRDRDILTKTVENYYENLKRRRGGIVYATDDHDYHSGMFNDLMDVIGYGKASGLHAKGTPIEYDSNSEIFSTPFVVDRLFNDTTTGTVPTGPQPNGDVLHTVAWHVLDSNEPAVSTTITGPVECSAEFTGPDPSAVCSFDTVVNTNDCGQTKDVPGTKTTGECDCEVAATPGFPEDGNEFEGEPGAELTGGICFANMGCCEASEDIPLCDTEQTKHFDVDPAPDGLSFADGGICFAEDDLCCGPPPEIICEVGMKPVDGECVECGIETDEFDTSSKLPFGTLGICFGEDEACCISEGECGDGVWNSLEECDDGNDSDSCWGGLPVSPEKMCTCKDGYSSDGHGNCIEMYTISCEVNKDDFPGLKEGTFSSVDVEYKATCSIEDSEGEQVSTDCTFAYKGEGPYSYPLGHGDTGKAVCTPKDSKYGGPTESDLVGPAQVDDKSPKIETSTGSGIPATAILEGFESRDLDPLGDGLVFRATDVDILVDFTVIDPEEVEGESGFSDIDVENSYIEICRGESTKKIFFKDIESESNTYSINLTGDHFGEGKILSTVAGEYEIKIKAYDNAVDAEFDEMQNETSFGSMSILIVAGNASDDPDTSTLNIKGNSVYGVESCAGEGLYANNADTCDFELILKDRFGNPIMGR